MTINRQQVGTAVTAAAAFLAGGLCLNPIVASVVVGIGANLLTNDIQEGVNVACQRLGRSWILNDAIQKALQRAFRNAVEYLKRTYRDSPHYQQSQEKEFIDGVFADLRQAADSFFTSTRRNQETPVVLDLLQDTTDTQIALSKLIDELCDTDEHLREFIKQHLVEFLASFVLQELTTDEQAWQQVQLLGQREIRINLSRLQADSQEAQTLLRELPEKWEQLSRGALDKVAHDLTTQIDARFAETYALIQREAAGTRDLITTQADRVIREVVEQLQKAGLVASRWPPSRPPNPLIGDPLIGRKADLEKVLEDLQSSKRAIGLVGYGGLGKTALARAATLVQAYGQPLESALAQEQPPTPLDDPPVLWYDLANESPDGLREKLAHDLNLPDRERRLGTEWPDVRRVLTTWRPSRLVVFNDLPPDLTHGPGWVKAVDAIRQAGCPVLWTSRQRFPATLERYCERNCTMYDLDRLADDAAVDCLLGYLPEQVRAAYRAATDANRGPLVEVATQLLGGLPLALKLAGSHLTNPRPSEWSGWRDYVRDHRLEVADELGLEVEEAQDPKNSELSIRAAFALSYQKLSPTAQRHFALLGIFPDGFHFSRNAVAALWGGANPWEVGDSLTSLDDASLVDVLPDAERMQLHPLLAEYARDRLTAEDRAAGQAALTTFYRQYARDYWNDVGALAVELPMLRLAHQWAEERGAEPVVDSGTLEGTILSKGDGPDDVALVCQRFAESDVLALGQLAGDTSVPGQGTEADLLHFTVDVDGEERILLPVYTRTTIMTDSVIRNPEWQTLMVLQVNGDALLRNLNDDVIIVIDPWSILEFQIPPDARQDMNPPSGPISIPSLMRQPETTITPYGLSPRLLEDALRRLGNIEGAGNALLGMGTMAHSQGDYETARTYYEHGLALAREENKPQVEAKIQINLGVMLFQIGEQVTGSEMLRAAISTYERLGMTRELANCRIDLQFWEATTQVLQLFAKLIAGRASEEELWAAKRQFQTLVLSYTLMMSPTLVAQLRAQGEAEEANALETRLERLHTNPTDQDMQEVMKVWQTRLLPMWLVYVQGIAPSLRAVGKTEEADRWETLIAFAQLRANDTLPAYSQLEMYKQAIKIYDLVMKLDGPRVDLYINRGNAYAALQQFDQALADYSQAIDLDPNNPLAYGARGHTYYTLKEYERAVSDYSRVTELDPHNVEYYRWRGNAYAELKQFDHALADYSRVIELDPDNALDFYNRGVTYSDLKEYERAVADLSRAIDLDPNNRLAYNDRGVTYSDLKEYERAIADLSRAIDLAPTYGIAYTNRGRFYLWQRNIAQARADFARAVEIDPTSLLPALFAEWSSLSKQRGGIEMAERFEEIASIKPQESQEYIALVCQAIALGLRDKLEEGLEELDKAITLMPEKEFPYFWKGILSAYHTAPSDAKDAIESIQQALVLGLPPILLTPLYWLEHDRPEWFSQYARPLLDQYGI